MDQQGGIVPNSMARELEGHTQLVLKQSRKGWLRECFGCEAETRFYVSDEGAQPSFYLLEKSSCAWRVCCPTVRPWITTLSVGGEEGGEPIVTYTRPFRCAPGPSKCCCRQTVVAADAATGAQLGSVSEDFYCCVPQMSISDASGVKTHVLHQPTCCGGLCVNPCDPNGGGCCKVPFYLYSLQQPVRPEPVGRVVKAWGGMKRELLTDADTFQMHAPSDAPTEHIATLIGATLLLNQLYFETALAGNTNVGPTPMV